MTNTNIDQTTARRILDLPMQDNDADAATIRDYLTALLARVWQHGECFSGKRPFGNSGWADDLYQPLVTAGLITGRFDEYGYLDDADYQSGDRMIAAAIRELGTPPNTEGDQQ